jgi:C-terminal processing protease CtpA/Prc
MKTIKNYIIIVISILLFFSCNEESRRIHNIETFAKVYGYARWFHPSDEAQEIDWDKFAILGVQKVENIKTDAELKDALLQLFSPIVQGLQIYETGKQKEVDLDALIPPGFTKNKVIAWQHYGVYLSERSKIFNSIRINKPQKESYSFFNKYMFDVSSIQGREVKLSGYFKIASADSKGKASFYLCPLRTSEMFKSPSLLLSKSSVKIKSTEWDKYEMTYKIDTNTEYFNFGCALENDISLLADNFELSVKKGESWETIDSINMGFELGEIDNNLNNWQFNELMHKIEFTESDVYSGKYGLRVEYTGKQFDQAPGFGEKINEPIGSNLSCVVPLALYESNSSTFPKTDGKLLDELKTEISNVIVPSGFNRHVNLGSIVIAWNIFQHFYPYFDVIKTNWEKVLPQTLEKAYLNSNKKDFTITLSEMVAELEDGHGVVSGERMYHLPIRTEWIENKIVITASKDPQFKIGDIITKVNGIDANKVQQKTENIISGSPQLKKHRALNVFGSKFETEITNVTVERNGKKVSCDVQNKSTYKNMFFNSINEIQCKSDDIKEIEPGIFYVNLKNCTYEDVSKQIEILAGSKSVIYDYRWGGKLNLINLIPHLTDASVNSAWWNIPQVIYPNRREITFHKTNWSLEPKLPHFTSKSIIITAPCVVSSGETSMGIIDHYNLATTVGEPTAGCNGNANWVNLPSGYRVMWTGMKVLKHDESQHHLIGFLPDYPVERTLQGLKEGKDEALEKALEIAKNINTP